MPPADGRRTPGSFPSSSGTAIERHDGTPAETLAEDEWTAVGHRRGPGLRTLAVIDAPDVIVLGGGVAGGGGERLLAPARQVLDRHLRLVPKPIVRLSRLGYDSALWGTIALARGAQQAAPAPA